MPQMHGSGTPRRKVFISYHHGPDQSWNDRFSLLFEDAYEVFYDESLDGRVRSDDAEYVNRVIREENIVGSSITIVLCGAETWKRKYVDWEIHSTLHHEHALLGIQLESAQFSSAGRVVVPARLHSNIASGYAKWTRWTEDPALIESYIEAALDLSHYPSRIDNSAPKMERNRS